MKPTRSHSSRSVHGVLLAVVLLAGPLLAAEPPDSHAMKRRQQGILTGMPFMANVAPRTFVDDLGRKLYLATTPKRVVSLAPSFTEIVYAIGAGDLLVAVTPFCDYPAEARDKPKIAYSSPNVEAIVALRPDLVLAPREFIRADILAKLDQLKIPTFVLEAKTVDEIPSHIQTVGRMVGRPEAADQVALDMRRRLMEFKSKMEGVSRPRVLYVLNSEPLISVGPGSFIHQLIELAGGHNVAARAPAPYPRLSLEEVLKEDPQLIVFPVGSAEGIPPSEQDVWKRWTTISAVKGNGLHRITSDLLNRPGPRIVLGLAQLAAIIHPELFDVVESSASPPVR